MDFLFAPQTETQEIPFVNSDTWVNKEEALFLLDISKNDPVHAIALNMLRNALFSEDLQIKVVDETLKSSPPITDVELYTRLFYSPTGEEAFRGFIANGYVCWTYSETTDDRLGDKPVVVPVVVDRSRYDILQRIHPDERVERFVCVLRGGVKQRRDNFHLFFIPGMEPCSISGKHNSVITPLIQDYMKLQILKGMEAKALQQRSHPPYILEPVVENGGGGSSSDKMIHTTDAFNIQNNAEGKKQALVHAINEDTFAKSIRPALGIVREETGERTVIQGPQSTYDSNKRFIPHGYKAASTQPPLPEAPKEVMERELAYQKLVFANYGVPYSLALGDGKTASSGGAKQTANLGGDNDLEMFQRSLLQYTKHMEFFYQEVWYHSFPGKTKREDLRFLQRRIPITTSGSLHGLFNQGIIHKDSLKRRLAQVHGLAEDDIADEENEITRPPPGGSADQTTSMMAAKMEVMRAEAKERLAKAAAAKEGGIEGQKELMKIQIDFEQQKANLQLEILKEKLKFEKKKIDLEEQKIQQEKEKIPIEKEKAKIQIQLEKQRKKQASRPPS